MYVYIVSIVCCLKNTLKYNPAFKYNFLKNNIYMLGDFYYFYVSPGEKIRYSFWYLTLLPLIFTCKPYSKQSSGISCQTWIQLFIRS